MNTKIKRELNKRAIAFGESLMPHDCISIMQGVIGKRMDKISYKHLVSHCRDMMATATDVLDTYAISCAVNDFMDS